MSLDRAVDRLQAAELKLEPSEILNGKADRSLEGARREFEAAYADMDSVFVAPFRMLPVVGRQINVVRAMSGSAGKALAVAEDSRRDLKGVLHEGWDKRGQRVPSMLAFEKIADRALADLRDLDLGPREALDPLVARCPGPVPREVARGTHPARAGSISVRRPRGVPPGTVPVLAACREQRRDAREVPA